MSADLLKRLGTKFTIGDDCWEWTGAKSGGYGYIKVNNKNQRAHRVLYELMVGPIPQGLELDHTCSNRCCVRPGHMEPVTHRVNSLRSNNLCAQRARQTHCKRGHELTEENTYASSTGGRACRACAIEASKAAWRKKKAQRDEEAQRGVE